MHRPSSLEPPMAGRYRRRLMKISDLVIFVVCVFTAACAAPDDRAGKAESAPPASIVTATGIALPPAARVGTHIDTMHGVPVPDPYRWLEDTAAVEARTWVAAQETYATAVLARTLGQDSLTALYRNVYRDAPTLSRVVESPTGLTMTRWLGDAPSLLVAAHDATGERELMSSAAIAKTFHGRIREIGPSPTGALLAITTTATGDSRPAVMVVNATTGVPLADRIPDMLTTASATQYQVNWLLPDSSAPAFLYPQLWPGSERGPLADRLARGRIFLHHLGRPQSTDVAVFGYGVSPDVPFAPEDLATRVYAAPGSRWLIGSVFRSSKNGREDYAARRTANDATVPSWTPVIALEDYAGYPQLRGDTAYVSLRRDADRGRLARRVFGDGARPAGNWETVVSERRGVITAFSVVGDGMYFTERVGGALSLSVLPPDGSAPRLVSLPMIGTVRFVPRSPAMDGVLVSVQSWAIPPRWYHLSRAGTVVEQLKIDDGAKMSALPTLMSDRMEAKSRDGTMVPVSLVYDSAALGSQRLDGTAPLLLEAYGGFGDATDAMYDQLMTVWTALGGVYAYAHVRGGGELGDAWHKAAMRGQKGRSVEDVIGTVEALIARGYTAPGRVALQGISFGAVVAGLVPLTRPDLFGAIVYDVGGPDEVRAPALDPSAARNVAEIGDVDAAEGIRLLMAAYPYRMIPSRLAHPAMLIHSAKDDYNFGTEMLVAKYVARLQASHTGDRPVAWVRTEGGHRWLSSRSPESAGRQTAFLLWQLGDVRYQPPFERQ